MAKKRKEEKPKEYTRRQLSHFQQQKRRQRIVFISGISIIVAILLIILLGWFLGEYRPMHTTVIKVKDTELNTGYFIDMLKIAGENNPSQSLDTMSSSLIQSIVQNELIRQAAEEVGIIINDDEIRKTLENAGKPVTKAYIDIVRAQQLPTRVKDEYIGHQVPVSDNQVYMMAMMVESESVAQEIHDKLVNGDNFTALAEKFAWNYYSRNVNKGDFDWHPRGILEEQVGSGIPLDFAFGAEPGTLSPPLSDNQSYKRLGYWLIKVLNMSEEEEGEVQALFLSSQEEALNIKARLESGDNLSALADHYSQYSSSKEKHGELGWITKPASANITAVSKAFDGYVFDPATELGKWSDPIRDEGNPVKDEGLWTKGGYWLVKVIDKENNRKLSEEDRTYLISSTYDDWLSKLWVTYAADIDSSGLTEDMQMWAVERARKDLQSTGG